MQNYKKTYVAAKNKPSSGEGGLRMYIEGGLGLLGVEDYDTVPVVDIVRLDS